MRVTLTKRLGQNKPGTVIDTTVTQARWMFERGCAVAADELQQADSDVPTSTTTTATSEPGDTPKAAARRKASPRSAAKPGDPE